ncbi:MAG TPA: ribosome maturation factor RimP [Acidimicrobiales bacterium]|jgi:ribosome maturation factor RimP|nr:ribosome maturation factor RimP [Acidimicrobiales bacterium]
MTEDLFSLLEPAVNSVGLELFDVELKSGVVLVTVDRPGGVDLEALTDANRVVSVVLDERDPVSGSYTLEVSSPGVERTLRTPAHFTKAVGETVTVKTRSQVPGPRRLKGTLSEADADGIELTTDDLPEGRIRLAYSDMDRVRTVFGWGPTPKAGGAKTGGSRVTTNTKTTEKRKQVTTP